MSQSSPLSSDENAVVKPPGIGDASPPSPVIAMPPQPAEDHFATTRKWLMEIVEEIERINPDLPSDLAANHEYYRLGRRRSDD